MSSPSKTPPRRVLSLRKLHRTLAPVMLLPLLLTLFTGSLYQFFELIGKDDGVNWLMALHKGNVGPLHLEIIYPFLNAAGLLILTITGISMWRQMQRHSSKPKV